MFQGVSHVYCIFSLKGYSVIFVFTLCLLTRLNYFVFLIFSHTLLILSSHERERVTSH